ncbi:MAG: hypothetical protein M3Q30_17360 [Actinomycetota bacterium]|nr:hypothetical protein [Actinomycetota bacterium]
MRKPVLTGRCLPIVGALLVPVALGSCSGVGRSKSSSPPSAHPAACTFVAKLDEIASAVKRADVRDPNAFKKTLDSAVHDYVANVRELRAVVPVELHDGLERVEADVQQYRFDAALTDRVPLDAYAARTCGRVVNAATTSGPPTSGSVPTTLSGG